MAKKQQLEFGGEYDLSFGKSDRDNGVYASIVDLDRLYEKYSPSSIVVNDYDMQDQEQADRFQSELMVVYENSVLSTVPHCRCMYHRTRSKVGKRCPKCNTMPATPIEQPMIPVLWIRVPDGVEYFINPMVYRILSETFRGKKLSMPAGFDLMAWLIDPKYNPSNIKKTPPIVNKLEGWGWERSLNNFYHRFDEVIEWLIAQGAVASIRNTEQNKRASVEMLREFIRMYRDKIFCKYLPVPNKNVFTAERNNNKIRVDKTLFTALNTVRNVMDSDRHISAPGQRTIMSRAARVVTTLSKFYHDYMRANADIKQGYYRRHASGSLLDHTGRAVITSLTGPHDNEEIHIPWTMGVILFNNELMAMLRNMGYSLKQAKRLLFNSVKAYHPLIDELMTQIVEGAPEGFISVIFNRNPTIRPGSIKNLKLTYVKGCKNRPDLVKSDMTISFSVLQLKSFNADFDGDEMQLHKATDMITRRYFEKLRPHRTLADLNSVDCISGNATLTSQVSALAVAFVHENE